MKYTDSSIPLTCGECEALVEGLMDMTCHLIDDHNYTPDEAMEHAQLWANAMYDEEEEWNRQEAKR